MGIRKLILNPIYTCNYKLIIFLLSKLKVNLNYDYFCNKGFIKKCSIVLGWFCYLLAIFLISFEISIIYTIILPFELLYKPLWHLVFILPLSIYLIVQIFFNYNCAVFTKPGAPKKINLEPRCRKCYGYKPYGTHHCGFCDQCVIGMDHHCIWINQCVGARNHRFFFQFLAFLLVGTFVVMIYGFNTFWKHLKASSEDEIFCHRKNDLDYLPWYETFCSRNYRLLITNMAIFGYLLPTIIFFPVGFLAIWNFILISNRTTQANFVQENYFDLKTIKSLILSGVFYNNTFKDVWRMFLGLEQGRNFIRHILFPSLHISENAKVNCEECGNEYNNLIHII
uniref:Palmitoyltransferase n=1 Tax=Strongyloides papillosus TaxID=174720 RepID=A0A0N5C5R5_STREA